MVTRHVSILCTYLNGKFVPPSHRPRPHLQPRVAMRHSLAVRLPDIRILRETKDERRGVLELNGHSQIEKQHRENVVCRSR